MRRRTSDGPTQPIPVETLREVAGPVSAANGCPLAPIKRAIDATDAEHAAAIAGWPCTICGADPGVECLYGGNFNPLRAQQFPGKAHTRRLREYLGSRP